jgi:ADP-heptose:LPS heptosyltransferase
MSEFPIAVEENDTGKYPVAMPNIPDLRVWASIIDVADHFVGVDSVGQHIAKAMGKTATVICGATFPVNISYPNSPNFDIIDLGKEKRVYDPIRISLEDEINRANDEIMEMDKFQMQQLLQLIRKRLGKSTRFKGKFVPPQQEQACCTPESTPPQPMFSASGNTLKLLDSGAK